jgi:hypothetical protein
MRAKEFITEAFIDKLLPDQAGALPATYIIPELPNQDPYLQYRFSVAIAGAKGREQREKDNVPRAAEASEWGENEIVVSYGHDVGPYIDDALKTMGLSGKKMISTPTSVETTDVVKTSPINAFKGYPK